MSYLLKYTSFGFSFFIKVAVFILSLYFLYKEIFLKYKIFDFYDQLFFVFSDYSKVLLFLFVFNLMFVNWYFESLKWSILIKRTQKHTPIESLKAVFTSLSIGSITPNRIGEVLGKLIFVKKENRIKAIFLSGIGAFSQLFFTCLFGAISFFILYANNFLINNQIMSSMFVFVVILFLSCLLAYVFKNTIKNLIVRLNWVDYFKSYKEIRRDEFFYVFSFSLLRYMVFFFQYYLLLILFDVKLSLIEALGIIPAVFFTITAVPTFFIADLGVRGAVSIYFFSPISGNLSGIVLAAFFLWFINIAIPSMIGNYIVFKTRLNKVI